MLQVLVQVLAALIDAGTVCHLSSVACPQGFHCPASGFVTVEVTVDALVPVQMFQSLFHVGDGVQHKAVTRCQTERDGGQEVHKALEHAAHVRRDVPRLDQRHVLWWYATLETAASGFIAARHVRKADGKVPLTTHAVVQAAAVAGCNGIRDASFLQILRQRRAEQRDGFHSLKGRFGRFRQVQRLFCCGKRHTGGFRYESRLRHEIPASGKLPDKREDVAALAQAEVVPELFRHVHTEGGRAFTAVWRTIPQLVSAPSDRLMSQPCEKVRNGLSASYSSMSVRSMRTCQLMIILTPTPRTAYGTSVVSPPHRQALPEVGEQGDTVSHVKLHIERQRTAVDEGVPVMERGAVMQHLSRPSSPTHIRREPKPLHRRTLFYGHRRVS